MRVRPALILAAAAYGFALSLPALAVDIGSTQTTTTTGINTPVNATALSPNAQATLDTQLAQMWNLSTPEIQRARLLMQGPRGAFSSSQLSPIEVLGIHARTDAERARYAKLFAQVSLDDTQRVLAWSRAAGAEVQRITAGMQVLNYDGVPKAAVSEEAADMLGVPRDAVVPPLKKVRVVKQRAPIARSLGRAADNRGRAADPAVVR